MTEDKCCEPCGKFLRGEISLHRQSRHEVYFTHHPTFHSYERAMQMPCLLCSMAWKYTDKLPSAINWQGMLGIYHDAGFPTLRFCSIESRNYRSESLFFDPIPGSSAENFNKKAYNMRNGTKNCSVRFDLAPNTRSDSAIDFLMECYLECRTSHRACRAENILTSYGYPSRLLDVGQEENDLVKVFTTGQFDLGEYVCLSHCWGKSTPFSLNAETHQVLSKGVRLFRLPKTFQDAVFVTRRLRIQYLWIDSLCIPQDDLNEWATEASRMGDIYAGAVCTFAATSATDSSGGLFFERNPELVNPVRIQVSFDPAAAWLEGQSPKLCLQGMYFCDVEQMAGYCIEKEALNKRAWVSQERQLSRRTMHFTRIQLFWECHEYTASETYPKGLPDQARPDCSDDPTILKTELQSLKQSHEEQNRKTPVQSHISEELDHQLYRAWCNFRIAYSACGLSHDSDKLVALHGIAQQISQLTGDELVAGLWKGRMLQELCWYIPHPKPGDPAVQPLAHWRAPTWSWACSNAKIWVSNQTKFHGFHSQQTFEAKLIHIGCQKKVSGELENAAINMRCKLLPAILKPSHNYEVGVYSFQGTLEFVEDEVNPIETLKVIRAGTHESVQFSMDNICDYEQKCVYITVIQRCLHKDTFDSNQHNRFLINSSLEGLILQVHDKDAEQYRRIGLLGLLGLGDGSAIINELLSAHRMAEEKTITLV